MASIDSNLMACRIYAEEWYKREDFLEWLNSDSSATWHVKGEPVKDYSDAFIWVDYAAKEGSDFNAEPPHGLPKDIQETIYKLITEKYGKRGWTGGYVHICPMPE